MRHIPTLGYVGLTIVIDHPSRHDKAELISGYAGDGFWRALQPISRTGCEIITADEFSKSSLRKGTKVVLLLGQESLDLIKSKDEHAKILEYRGSPIVADDGVIYIPTIAPQDAYDRKNYESEDEEEKEDAGNEKSHQKTERKNWKFWMQADLRKTVRILFKGLLPTREFQFNLYPPIDEVTNLLSQTTDRKIYLDIETDENFKITCIGISISGSDCIYVLPFKRYNGEPSYNIDRILRFLISLQESFSERANNTVVIHNSSFDLFVLAYRYRIPFPFKVFDTMLSWHRCGYTEVEKSLGHLVSCFTDLPFHKNEGVFDPKNVVQEQQLWKYNAKDISTMILVEEAISSRAAGNKGIAASIEQVNSSIIPYLTMSYQGCLVDVPRYIAKFDELEDRREELGKVLRVITNVNLNPRSPKQVSEYLYDRLGIEKPDKDPTNEKQLLKILTKRYVPSIKVILDYRGCGKLASSLKFRLWNCGHNEQYDRATCSYKIAGSKDLRLGSSTLLEFGPNTGFGTNMQNWHKSVRNLVIAESNKILLQVDQAGAEALIVAYLCRLGRFRTLFLNRIKIHVFVGLHLFKEVWKKHINATIVDACCLAKISDLKNVPGWKELEQIIKDSDNWEAKERYYYMSKQLAHSANYGVKAPSFQMNTLLKSEGSVALSLEQCKKFLSFYHNLFPEIQEWHFRVQKQLSETKTIYNIFGYPRIFIEQWGETLFKDAYAYGPQSSVACITHKAATILQDKIRAGQLDLDLLQNGHDSLLAQTTIGNEKVAGAEMIAAITPELVSPFDGSKFKMGAEIQCGMNWGPYHEKKNPNGLRELKL